MGNFRVVVDAVGGHGCQRGVKDGERVIGCGQMDCPDCQAREFVDTLKRRGASVTGAKLIHWPGQPDEVEDDLLTRVRKGSF